MASVSGVATLGPTGALAPPSASVAPPSIILTYHVYVTNVLRITVSDPECRSILSML